MSPLFYNRLLTYIYRDIKFVILNKFCVIDIFTMHINAVFLTFNRRLHAALKRLTEEFHRIQVSFLLIKLQLISHKKD